MLTQELVQGKSWSDALAADQELRDSWAEAIHRFTYGSYHHFYVFNADPHPGNYLFHEDGSVSFLDFGCVKRLQREQVESLNLVMREALRGDVRETWRVSVEGGFLKPSGSLTPEEVFAYWHDPIEMYWGEQPFTVTPEYVARLIELRYSPTGPPANVFRHLVARRRLHDHEPHRHRGDVAGCRAARDRLTGRSIAAEYFEDADPVTRDGQSRPRLPRAAPSGEQPCLTGRLGRFRPMIPTPPTTRRGRRRPCSGTSGSAPISCSLTSTPRLFCAAPSGALIRATAPSCSPPSAGRDQVLSCGASRC